MPQSIDSCAKFVFLIDPDIWSIEAPSESLDAKLAERGKKLLSLSEDSSFDADFGDGVVFLDRA